MLEIGTSYKIIEVAVKMYRKKYFTLTDNSSDIHVGE